MSAFYGHASSYNQFVFFLPRSAAPIASVVAVAMPLGPSCRVQLRAFANPFVGENLIECASEEAERLVTFYLGVL